MTFAHPWLLALLAAVPLLAWLHRRRAPVVVRVASVAPYRAGPRTAARAERRGIDPLLVALLVAAASLALAAAGPQLVTGAPSVLLVRDETPSMSARTAGGTTVGESADARAQSILRELGVVAERWPLRPGEDVAAKAAAAAADGFPGLLFVTDRTPAVADPATVVVGPAVPAIANVTIAAVSLDGDRAHVVVRHLGGDAVRVTAPGGSERDLAAGEEWIVDVDAPPRGASAEIRVRCDDALDADDRIVVRRVGGVRNVRLVGESPRVSAALRALGVGLSDAGEPDATVTVGGSLGEPESRSVQIAPRGHLAVGAGLALETGARDVDAASLVASGRGDFPVPSPSARLVATGRIAPTAGRFQPVQRLLSDAHGIVAAQRGSEVAIVLDPDDPGSDWHRDGSFVATIGASLDLVSGGPERLEAEDPFPAEESAVARDAVAAPDAEAVRRVVRPAAATDLSAALASVGALAAAAAAVLGSRRR